MSETKKDNTRFVMTLLCMVVISSLAIFVVVHALRLQSDGAKINRDGISCILEELNAHRMNSYAADQDNAAAHKEQLRQPAPAAQPVPRELLKACERFLNAP